LAERFRQATWRASPRSFAFWWECHEEIEGIWHVVGHATRTGQFLQGIIQVAAGNLKQHLGVAEGATRLWTEALGRLKDVPSPYAGVDVRGFEGAVRGRLEGRRAAPALIRLSENFPPVEHF
jgi:predicted metal-dependent hydrolase